MSRGRRKSGENLQTLISKANCPAMNSSKKRMNEFVFTCMRHVLVCFLEDIEQKAFKNHLTLSLIVKTLLTPWKSYLRLRDVKSGCLDMLVISQSFDSLSLSISPSIDPNILRKKTIAKILKLKSDVISIFLVSVILRTKRKKFATNINFLIKYEYIVH